MTLSKKLAIIDKWLTFRRRVYAVPGHFSVVDNGRYEVMTPIGGAKGIPEAFNIRLEGLSDIELQKTVEEIKNIGPDDDFHIQWPYGCSDRVHLAARGEIPVHPLKIEVFGIMLPSDRPGYPPPPTGVEFKKVVTQDDFVLWCGTNAPLNFWGYDKERHFHLVQEGKIVCFMAIKDGKCIASAMVTNDDGEAALDSITIVPEYRNKSIDTALCRHTIRQAFEMGVKFIIGYAHPTISPDDYRIFKELKFPVVES